MNKLEQLARDTAFYQKKKRAIPDTFLIDAPYMTKFDMQEHQDDLLIEKYQSLNRRLLLKIRTSGSTGKIVETLWEKNDYIVSNLCLWRLRKKYYGIQNTDFFLTFHSSVYSGTQVRDIKDIEIIHHRTYLSLNKFCFTENNFLKYAKEIKRADIIWIFTQPSMLLILAKLMQDHHILPEELFPKLKYIEVNGEIMFESDREMLRNFFNVPIANLYGASEVNGIAYQCPEGHLHILENNVIVQLYNSARIDADTYEGEIAVSSLHNKAMPIVSYALGDKVRINRSINCNYSSSPKMSVLIGRSSDRVPLAEGISISSYQVSYWIETVNSKIGNPILEYKVKSNEGACSIYLYIKSDFVGWEGKIISTLREQIREIYSGDNIEYICLNRPIDLSSNGKVRSVEHNEQTLY